VLELLSECHLAAGNPAAALEAIEQAQEAERDSERTLLRANILCDHFPEREEDAFDDIYRYVDYSDYSSITSRPAYAVYAARREADDAARKASWRWSAGDVPADEAVIADAECSLGGRLPDDYRTFLKERGKSTLYVRTPEEDAKLDFFRPEQLAKQRDYLLDFITMTEDLEEAAAAFRDEYGVSLQHLIPVAEPRNASNALLLHIGPGDNYGRAYVWNHDGAFELVYAQPSFGQMMRELLDGIEKLDETALDLFNIRPD